MVRISGFHPGGPGSIPGAGTLVAIVCHNFDIKKLDRIPREGRVKRRACLNRRRTHSIAQQLMEIVSTFK